MKKLLLVALMFVGYSITMEKDEQEIDLSMLPADITREISSIASIDYIISNAKTAEEAGNNIRNLYISSKAARVFVQNHFKTIINKLANRFKIPQMLAALYLGTKPAISWFDQTIETVSQEQKGQLLKNAITLFTGSKQSKEIISLLEKHGFSQTHYLAGQYQVTYVNGSRLILFTNPIKPEITFIHLEPHQQKINEGKLVHIPLHINSILGIVTSKENIIVWGRNLHGSLFVVLATQEGKILGSYGLTSYNKLDELYNSLEKENI